MLAFIYHIYIRVYIYVYMFMYIYVSFHLYILYERPLLPSRSWWRSRAVTYLDADAAAVLWTDGVGDCLGGQPLLHCMHHLLLC